MSFFKKEVAQVFQPLMPRQIDEELIGLSLDEFIAAGAKNKLRAAITRNISFSQNHIDFDNEIQYLIETVVDLKPKQKEIERLWTLVLEIIKEEKDSVSSLRNVYLYPLISITGEAQFSLTERQFFLNKLEGAMDDFLDNEYSLPDGFIQGISDLLHWQTNLLEYQRYLGVGPRFGNIVRIKTITDQYVGDVESLKSISPFTFIGLVDYIKYAYQHDDAEHQIKLRGYYLKMLLQKIVVAKNNGFYQDYYQMLADYYQVLYRDRPITHWLFRNLTGYGEKPWKLFWLFIGINFVFSLLFTLCAFDFKFQTEPHGFDRFVSFFYFNNTSMLTVGYGDIYPQGTWTKITVVFLQLSGFTISGAAIALFLKRILRF